MSEISEDLLRDMFGFTAPTEQQLSSISLWASKALELHANIEQVEEHLGFLKKELQIIEEVNLPQALLEAGLEEFKLKGGTKISIEEVLQGGLSKDEEKRAFTLDWIIKEGGGDIIRDHFEIDYPKGRLSEAEVLRKLLISNRISFDEFESIHAQTMKAFLREKMKGGTIPPFEDMGIRYFKKANIKVAK